MGGPAVATDQPPALGNTVITGASSGVGEAIALRLVAGGKPEFAIGRNVERLYTPGRRSAASHVVDTTPSVRDQ